MRARAAGQWLLSAGRGSLALEITDAGGVGAVASDAKALRRQLTDYRARCNAGQAESVTAGKASE